MANANSTRAAGFDRGSETGLEIARLDQAVEFYFRKGLATATHKSFSSAQKRYIEFL